MQQEAGFASRQELIADLNSRYEREGVLLTVKRSKELRVVLKCDRGGKYTEPLTLTDATPKRKNRTRLTGCEFEIVCSSVKGVWAVRKIIGQHNHPLSTDLTGHSVKRRLGEAEKARVRELDQQGLATKQILGVLRSEFSNNHTTAKGVYNELGAARAKELGERKPIEALVELISSSDYQSNVRMVDGAVNALFFSHQASVALCQTFSTAFLLDCTYKTNKFGMPLLNFVGITSTYQTFNAGFALLPDEKEASYEWALGEFATFVVPQVLCTDRELALMKGIATVFPNCKNLLCQWHISKNVLAHCKAKFADEDWGSFLAEWHQLVASGSVDELNAAIDAIRGKYGQSHPTVWQYVNATWLPLKERFVACFVNEFPHFGSASTSRVEGNHHVLKSYIRGARLHPLTMAKRVGLMLANQRVELNAAAEGQKLVKAHRFTHNCFANLTYKVSTFAMDKLLGQLKLAQEMRDGNQVCTSQFTKSWGLPCRHVIRCCLETDTPILLEDIHEQWLLDRNPLAVPVVATSAPPAVPESPRSSFMRKMATTLPQLLANDNPRAGSMIARLSQVLDTPDVQISEPMVVAKKRGRPAGAKNKTSATRDKSHFEYVDGRKCGVCGGSGHNARTCKRKQSN